MSHRPRTPHNPVRRPTRATRRPVGDLPRRPLRPADPANPGRTDTSPAGRVLLVIVAALVAAAVLNAQALHEDAQGKPLGTARTVSLAIWGPVARVSAAFGLDRPRNMAEDALGRADDGPTVTVTVPPAGDPVSSPATDAPGADPEGGGEPGAGTTPSPGPATAAQAAAEPPPLPAATPEDPLQVLLVGDSTMTQLGGALTRQLAETGLAQAETDARPATGFSRPDFFDWPSRLAELAAQGPADLTIAMFGANDAQGFEHEGQVHDFGSESWIRIYRARVATAMDVLVAGGSRVVWVGQPAMRSASFDAKVRVIDEIVRAEAARRPAIRYVDARAVLGGPDGAYAEYRTADDGTRTRIRDGDGIHLTTAGADLLAAAVLEPVLAELAATGPGG